MKHFHQIIRFAGVGAHHHNGHAERSIGTIMSITRAMLIHSALHWPELADPSLWPMCVAHAVYIWNHVPDPSTGLSPTDLFTRTRWKLRQFQDLHVFGCPTYVLDNRLSDGKKIPKWKPRSTRCMYVGTSPTHASTVPLVLNPDTGTITPRFHIVFDDWFQTVSTDVDALPDFNAPAWKQLFGESEFQYEFDGDDLEQLRDLTDTIDTSVEALNDAAARERVQSAMDLIRAPPSSSATSHQQVPKSHVPPVPVSQPLRTSHPSTSSPSHPVLPSSSSVRPSSTVVRPEGEKPVLVRPPNVSKTPPIVSTKPSSPKEIVSTSVSMKSTPPKATTVPTLKRSRRLKAKSPSQSQESSSLTLRRSRRLQSLPPATTFLSIFAAFGINTMSILAASKGTDSFTFDEAMRSEYKEEFIAAAHKEIRELELHNTWKEVLIDSVTESIIPNTWVFTIKRRPDGSIKKN